MSYRKNSIDKVSIFDSFNNLTSRNQRIVMNSWAKDFAENVAQHYEDIDEDRVEAALREADLLEKIRTLPNGTKTHVGRSVFEDGLELSGGETQRLMLARALYKNAPIIVLDEPTAALDPISEHNLYMR